MEAGEKNTKYFFWFRKKRNNSCKQMNNGLTNDNPKDICCFVNQFYSKLYSSNNQLNDADFFLSNVSTRINKITSDYKTIKIVENTNCINSLKDNKSLGNYGLTREFYKNVCNDLAPFLLAVYKEAIDLGEMPASLKQGGNYAYTQT